MMLTDIKTETGNGTKTIIRALNNPGHKSMAEKINTISSSTYVQLGTVISIVLLTAFLIGAKVNTESDIRQLFKLQESTERKMEEYQKTTVTREYLDLKFENLKQEIKNLPHK